MEQPVGELREAIRKLLEEEQMTLGQISRAIGLEKKKLNDTLCRMTRAGEIQVAGFGVRDGTKGRIPFVYTRIKR